MENISKEPYYSSADSRRPRDRFANPQFDVSWRLFTPMKRITTLLFSTAIIALCPLVAQETKPETTAEKPAASATATAAAVDAIPLIPETVPVVEKSTATGGVPVLVEAEKKLNKSKSVATVDELKDRVRFREVKTLALKDSKVQEAWELSSAAKTEPDKRASLKRYYVQLYARMQQIDSSLKVQIEEKKKRSLAPLEKNDASAVGSSGTTGKTP